MEANGSKGFMKKLIAAASAIALVLSTAPAVTAAERPLTLAQCKKATATPRPLTVVKQPKSPAKPLPKKLILNTNCGEIVIALNPKAPQTITNMSALANGKFFDNSLCHRLTTAGIFVLQCGDPTYMANGNPPKWNLYKDENLPKAGPKNYPAGTVAMANPARANANGSQFFLVYQDTQLGPNYTIWGKITKGLDTVQKIGEIGALQWDGNRPIYAPDGDGEPIQQVAIIKATAK